MTCLACGYDPAGWYALLCEAVGKTPPLPTNWHPMETLPPKGRVIVDTPSGISLSYCQDIPFLVPPPALWMTAPESVFQQVTKRLESAA